MDKYNEIANELFKIYKECDKEISEFDTICSAGCIHCCKQPIPVAGIEEFAIKELLSKSPYALKNRIKKNMQSWFKEFNKLFYPLNRVGVETLNTVMVNKKTSFPVCPFLVDNRCSIYEARPLVCRAHIVKDNIKLCEMDPLRDPIDASKQIKRFYADQILQLQRNNMIRLLPYATRELIGAERIEIIQIEMDIRLFSTGI